MPRISDELREARREQILEAARACLQEHGLEAVSMEMIIARSGLSTGAVYGYFKGKNEIINAVVTEGTAELADELLPVLSNPDPPPLPELIGQVLRAVVKFSSRKPDVDRMLVSLHGWSHSQSDPALKAATGLAYRRSHNAYTQVVERWQAKAVFDPEVEPRDMAQLMTSITLGFVAQRALLGEAEISAHVEALAALS